MKIRKTVGIDLGTTNSVIALLDPTDSAILTGRDDDGQALFPSVVGHRADEPGPVAGRPAAALRRQLLLTHHSSLITHHSPPPVASVKRHMGLDRPFAVGPESLTPPEVSARILQGLRRSLARTLNDGRYLLDSAVITIPAYFNHDQIEATRKAGELAGFEVVELLHEPTAAAICYSWLHRHGDATYLVYDLGGGTFDVSILRRRFGDFEVLSVRGDPFLGGDDFDRLLASHLQEQVLERHPGVPFDPATPAGAANFAALVFAAEDIKVELSARERVERCVPGLLRDAGGAPLALEVVADRPAFERLIRAKVEHTLACCHEALAAARDKAGLRLGDLDHVVLVGGSSRVPLVRACVRAAFCNPDLPERARAPEPLLHEPDLCVAYGAALRAATHGTRFLFSVGGGQKAEGRRQKAGGSEEEQFGLELHVTSSPRAHETNHLLTGAVRVLPPAAAGEVSAAGLPSALCLLPSAYCLLPSDLEGASVRVRAFATGLTDEAFLDAQGTFAQEVELRPGADNAFELAVCDALGRELARAPWCVRHRPDGGGLGPAVLPTQLLTKPLAIEVLDARGRRVKQTLAPAGATLPATFACTCRTHDQAGRVVVPVFEENRVVKQMVVEHLDPGLPVGSPVRVEFHIDARHTIEVRVTVPGANRTETAVLAAPPPPRRPTRAEIDELDRQVHGLLPEFHGSYRTRVQARLTRLLQELHEALAYEDEPKAVQRLAELRELAEGLEAARGQALDPPWPHFAQLVRHALDLAAEVARKAGRDPQELFAHVHAQERYAEQAYEEKNQPLYRECYDNLAKYAGYLDQLGRDELPHLERAPPRPPEDEARDLLEDFRAGLTAVWKKARSQGRRDLDERLGRLAAQGQGLRQRARDDAPAAVREGRRLLTELGKIDDELAGRRRDHAGPDAGLLEGSS